MHAEAHVVQNSRVRWILVSAHPRGRKWGARRGAALSMECESCGASEVIEQGADSVCAICGTLAQQRVAEVVTWEEWGVAAAREARPGFLVLNARAARRTAGCTRARKAAWSTASARVAHPKTGCERSAPRRASSRSHRQKR